MTTSRKAGQPQPSTASSEASHAGGDARQRLDRLYREIGISAVAAAAAQIRKVEAAPAREPQMPAWLSDEAA